MDATVDAVDAAVDAAVATYYQALTNNAAALRATVCQDPPPQEQGSFVVHPTDGITGQRLTYSCDYGERPQLV